MTRQLGRVFMFLAISEKCDDRPGEYTLSSCVRVSCISTVSERMKLS